MQGMSGFGTLSGIAIISAGLVIAALALGACGRPPGTAPVAAAVPQAPARPSWPGLPENAACTKDLNHYQTVLDADVGTGNLNRSVYDEIEIDLGRAADACAAGRDGEARAIIRSTKVKHGYRASA
ncbi:MAG: hypothetical protein L0Y50_10525 [Beijerinckiaceae bacterium]|nr:hypothetical protein [Beijerinckiaceae bacterium]MCI0736686.1 hypothetical protein [Beijerinckiaceae bacterium]